MPKTTTATAAATTTAAAAATAFRPSRRMATIVSLVAVPAAVAVSGLVVAQSSYSAYSATTANPTNSWATGTVALSDDDSGTAAFTATNLKPGATGTKCIVVTSTGTLPAGVRLYGTGATTTKALASSINLTVTQGSGGSFGGGCANFTALTSGSAVYSGTLAGFGSTATDYSSGLGSWTTAGQQAGSGSVSEARTYQIAYSVRSDATNDTQNGTAAIGFTWEAQNS